ncbi:hypothetical protein M569_04517 [Genlisea aurea]|uniref:Voltage-dependent anion-selective channel protein n=1 Tax=Genlisea aurea TaxID=192259 RepID=S8CYX9_9LAMI|nr:hypothetical protein M569_04517 [Genlisea aurea]
MGNGPGPFSEIGRRARDLLTKDYNYDQKFSVSFPSTTGMGITATAVKKEHIFFGDLSTQYRAGKTAIDVKVDTYSNFTTKVTYDVLPGAKATISFTVPDHKSGKLDVDYRHPHAAINSSIGLNPSPLLEFAAAIGSKGGSIGGEVGFDAASSSFTKCNAGISFNASDFSAAVILADKGKTVKASYVHLINESTGTEIAAEMTHRLSSFENSFSIGSTHRIDPLTLVKTRFSDDGKIAVLSQREWRPKSIATFSAEYSSKDHPKFGFSIAVKP